MSYSTQRVVSDGSLVLLSVSIGYLERAHIKVFFNNAENDTLWNWVGTSDNQIAFTPAVPNGVEVLIARSTDLSAPYHVFSQGAQFTAESLDEDIAQILYIAQEATEQSLTAEFFQNVNMHGFKLTNVANAVGPQDAMTLGQATGTLQPYVGASSANAAAALSYKNAAEVAAGNAAASAASIAIPVGEAIVFGDSAGTAYTAGASGTTAQRPLSPEAGYTRFNTTLGADETWGGSTWVVSGNVTETGTATLTNKTLTTPVIEVIKVGPTNAVSLTAHGIQFTKNKLINGEVTRINQRAFDGTWSGKSVWETQPATIAGKEAAYGYDMWFRSNAARLDGTGASENMAQWIESGNFRPSTVHTLSGTGVTTTQITSPASGNWKIVVAQGATNVQVEEGSVATPFELRDIGYELRSCYRYFITYQTYVFSTAGRGGQWPVMMRATPYATASVGTLNTEGYLSWSLNTYGSYSATQLTASAVI